MTEQIMKLTINCNTQQEEYVPMTIEELAQRDLDLQETAAIEAQIAQAAEAKAAAKASAIAKLKQQGYTDEEIAALYS